MLQSAAWRAARPRIDSLAEPARAAVKVAGRSIRHLSRSGVASGGGTLAVPKRLRAARAFCVVPAIAGADRQQLTAELLPGTVRMRQITPRGNALPPVIHAKAAADGRIIVVGDVHGCLAELQALLEACGFRQGSDTLVLVGDVVTKGPASAAVVSTVRELGALAVRGNHDDAALAAYADHRAGRPVKDRHEWVAGLTAQDAAWLAALPFTLRLRDNICVVHAGMVPGVKRKRQQLQDLYTMRDVTLKKSGGWKASEAYVPDGTRWAEVWEGPRHVIFGHDAQRQLQLCKFATGLDTGCVYGGRLTACILPPMGGLRQRLGHVLASCFGRFGDARAPTLQLLGGKIVSVPSQQPRKK